ncbi:MAG: hypothetical protein CBD27_05925 [Rhodospirillaceae bacterium TMED167]|nr:hypothetical protein [Rhodospirillaceae bacterium]OUW27534.1 MAG: hypothetical protein CBD27_05925 [Rhodospirillaceae bacterium TMED167]
MKQAILTAEDAQDFVSREILNDILEDTKEHMDWLETQLSLVKDTGLQNYLQEQMFEISSDS